MNLTALQQSPFLQSLGWAIANSLWQATALWIVYHLINGAYKNASAKFKNNLSTILLSSSFVWFCITLFTKYFSIQNLASSYQVQFYQTSNITASSGYNWNSLLNKITAALPYLSVAYLLLLIFLSLRLINVYRFTRFIKYNGLQKPCVEWKLFTEKVARHMGIAKNIKLWVSHHIDVPATIGFIKPVILIPLASINRLSADQLEAIILHELSHIKRNDYLINLFISIIETVLFFNPFVVLLARIIKRERENCCDDFVIQYQYDRHTYASALLSLEQFRNTNLRLAIGATSGKKQLLVRIKRIMEINSNTNFNYGQKLAALFLITGVICSVAWLTPQNHDNKLQATKSDNRILERKIRKDEKTGTLNLFQNDNKINSISVTVQSQKQPVGYEQELKELKDLNLKAIAERESNRVNLLLQESKKEIIQKNFQRLNANKLLIAGKAYATPALFNNTMALPSFKSYPDFSLQKTNFDDQKLQAEEDKVQFSFDYENLQNDIKQAFTAKQLEAFLRAHVNLKISQADINHAEKIMKIAIQNSAESNLKRMGTLKRTPVAIAGNSNNNSYYFAADSLTGAETRFVKGRTKQNTAERYTTTSVGEYNGTPDYTGYTLAYGYSINRNDKNKKKVSEKNNEMNLPDEDYVPASPKTYKIITIGNNNPAKTTTAPKSKIQRKDNVRVESRNGIIFINGKKIDLPDNAEMLAQYTFKGKKIVSKAKDLMELHIED